MKIIKLIKKNYNNCNENVNMNQNRIIHITEYSDKRNVKNHKHHKMRKMK